MKRLIRKYKLEVIAFMFVMGVSLFLSAGRTAVYDQICLQAASKFYPNEAINCHNITGKSAEFQEEIRSINSQFNIWDTAASTITPCIAVLIISAYGDRYGRKPCILSGVYSTLAIYLLYVFCLSNISINVFILPIGTLLCGCGGQVNLVMNCIMQYVTDLTPKKEDLTGRIATISAVLLFGFTFGGIASSLLMQVWAYTTILWLAVCLTLVAIMCVHILLDGHSATVSKSKIDNSGHKISQNGETPFGISHLITDIWNTLFKPRNNNRRSWLLLALLCLFLGAPAFETTGPVLTLFAYEDPLKFTPQLVGMYFAWLGVVSGIGGALGSGITSALKWHETSAIMLSLISKILEYLAIAMSVTKPMLFLSSLLGIFTMLQRSAFQAVFVELVDPDETGKVTSIQGLVLDSARLTFGILLNAAYVQTATYFKGFAFVIVAGLAVVPMPIIMRMKSFLTGESMKKQS